MSISLHQATLHISQYYVWKNTDARGTEAILEADIVSSVSIFKLLTTYRLLSQLLLIGPDKEILFA